MKTPTMEQTRHSLMAFVMALKDDGHSPANVREVLRELCRMTGDQSHVSGVDVGDVHPKRSHTPMDTGEGK